MSTETQNDARTNLKLNLHNWWVELAAEQESAVEAKFEEWLMTWEGNLLTIRNNEVIMATVDKNTNTLNDGIRYEFQLPIKRLQERLCTV